MGATMIEHSVQAMSPMFAWVLIDSSLKTAALLTIAFISTWTLRAIFSSDP